MEKPPLTPDIDLRALILYDIYQSETSEKSFKKYVALCDFIGVKFIPYNEFEEYYFQYYNEHYYSDNRKRTPIKANIRACVFSDVIHNVPIEKSFFQLCNAFKKNFEPISFEKWYDRFHIRFASKRLQFSDLTLDVVEKIVDVLDLKSQLSFRKVSFTLRNLVDSRKPAYQKLKFVYHKDYLMIGYNNRYNVIYTKSSTGLSTNQQLYYNKKFIDDDYENIAIGDLAIALRNPKLHLKSFKCEFKTFFKYGAFDELLFGWRHQNNERYKVIDEEEKQVVEEYKNRMETLLKSLNHQISVESFAEITRDEHDSLSILPFLKPGTLKNLKFRYADGSSRVFRNPEKLFEFEQWKYAEHVDACFDSVPIESFFHLKSFAIALNDFSIEDLVKLKEILPKSANFKWCRITSMEVFYNRDTIQRFFNLTHALHRYCHIPIPNSEYYLKFKLDFGTIHIMKKHKSEKMDSQ